MHYNFFKQRLIYIEGYNTTMRYPTILEYINALNNPVKNFTNEKNLHMVFDCNGMPIFKRGKYGVVFKMTDGTQYRAVKCYLQERSEINRRLDQLQNKLPSGFGKIACPFKFFQNELTVSIAGQDDTKFPVLEMEWIEGQPLDVYLHEHLNDSYERYSLAYRFSQLASELRGNNDRWAHGDLKPNNIIVKNDGQLVLVDYEGMFVPELEGEKAIENGTEGFRHPKKTTDIFDESIDDFAIIVTLLSLLILAEKPIWLFHSSNWMVFDKDDLQNIIDGTGDYERVLKLPHIQNLRLLLKEIYEKECISKYDLLDGLKIQPNLWSFQSQKHSWYSKDRTFKDEYGILYNEDETHLLKGRNYILDQNRNVVHSYSINPKTRIVNNEAFLADYGGRDLHTIQVPKSVSIIGDKAFKGCWGLKSVVFSEGLEIIGDEAFSGCYELETLQLPNTLNIIGRKAFRNCRDMLSINIPDRVFIDICDVFDGCNKLNIGISNNHLYYNQLGDIILTRNGKKILWCNRSSKEKILHIPYGVEEICSYAFANVTDIEEVIFPATVKYIKTEAFFNCEITNIIITENVVQIEDFAFEHCRMLKSVSFTSSNPIIGKGIFKNCCQLQHVELSQDMKSISNTMFEGCKNLTIIAGEHLKEIANDAFKECMNLKMEIPTNNPNFCSINGSLYTKDFTKILKANTQTEHFVIPNSVKSIGEYSFANSIITSIELHSEIENIESHAFAGCRNLSSINLPNTVKHVGTEAFYGCGELTNIIMSGAAEYGFDVFGCTKVNYLFIPGDIKVLKYGMLNSCKTKILHIGEGIEKIEKFFIQNECPDKIIIPNTLRDIDEQAFAIWTGQLPIIEGPQELVSMIKKYISEYSAQLDYEESIANMMTD